MASPDLEGAASWEARAANAWADIVLVQGDAEVLLSQGPGADQDQLRADCESRKEILEAAKAELLPVPAGVSASEATVKGLAGQVDRIERLLDSCLRGDFAGAPVLSRTDIMTQEAITLDLERVRLNAS